VVDSIEAAIDEVDKKKWHNRTSSLFTLQA
jgi:hypothetical protein